MVAWGSEKAVELLVSTNFVEDFEERVGLIRRLGLGVGRVVEVFMNAPIACGGHSQGFHGHFAAGKFKSVCKMDQRVSN